MVTCIVDAMEDHGPQPFKENGTSNLQRRLDARQYLLELVALPAFQMAHGTVRLNIEQGEPLPAHASYGWRHIPASELQGMTDAHRDLAGSVRNKIAGVLPPAMKQLAEVLCLMPFDRLGDFCARVSVSGGMSLAGDEADDLLYLATLRLRGQGMGGTRRKRFRRRLGRINPRVCRPPVDSVHQSLRAGDAVSVSASQIYLHGRVACLPSAPDCPVLGVMREDGSLELATPPSPRQLQERAAIESERFKIVPPDELHADLLGPLVSRRRPATHTRQVS